MVCLLLGVWGCRDPETLSEPIRGPLAGTGAGATAAGGGGTGGANAGTSGSTAGAPAGRGGVAGGAAGSAGATASGKRPQDDRTFMIDETMLSFAALPNIETDRWFGVLDGAGYHIEVPKQNWNGILVMYAHGYAGTGPMLRITDPAALRPYLIERGYAWAASSYTKNYYDVRAGVEDTNKLALAFKRIAADNGRTLEEPTKRYIVGHSMGGHITGAAIEKEASETAANKVKYAAALPMCGVMGDVELFSYFAAFQLAAQKLAGTPPSKTPAEFMAVRQQTQDALFSAYPTATTPAGDKLKAIVRNLTGGARPSFDLGFAAKQWQDAVWGTFGGDGTVNGILNLPVTDTRAIEYQLDDDPALSEEEKTFNAEVTRFEPAPNPNPIREDGVRWVPVVNGEIDIPVLSIHTLGDLYVPFLMQQIYRQRVTAKGNADRLVQWSIRGTGHCEFTAAEQVAAFQALEKWEQEGVKPAGDEVLDRAQLKDPAYGCKFTKNTFSEAEMMAGTLPAARGMAPACP